jgi:catalase
MQAAVPVKARLSNGSGDPNVPDKAPTVRGLAVGFELPDGSRTDILSQTAPHFSLRSPEAFFDLIDATKPTRSAAWKLPLFLVRNPSVLRTLRANSEASKPPASLADPRYYAIHAFRWTDAEGGSRWVRYRLLPHSTGSAPPAEGTRNWLLEELRERLDSDPVRFDLELQIAGPGDDPHKASSEWAESAERVRAGTVAIESVAGEEDQAILFDPMRLTDGIEPSEDPILHFRPPVYSLSYERRMASSSDAP